MRPLSGLIRGDSRSSVSRIRCLARSRWLSVLLLVSTLACVAQSNPQRIVSTAPSITETLFALGVGNRVVGVSQFCTYPAEVQKLPKVGSYVKPDVEAIARLAPDLVILQQNSSDVTERLNALHITFIRVPNRTLEDVFTDVQLIGKAVGVPERSASLITQIKGSLDAIQLKAKPCRLRASW